MAAAEKTSVFSWEGVNRRGETIKGELTGASAPLVKAQLRKQGITPKRVKKVSQSLFSFSSKGEGQKIKNKDVTYFMRQMATMVKAGVPLVQSFDIVADGIENPSMKQVVFQIRDSVSSGNEFYKSLEHHPRLFDELTCNLVSAGEQAGTLDAMLESIADYKEKTEALKAKVKKAMMYPVITLLVAFAVTLVLLIKVIPSFESMFANFDAELPAPTQFIVTLSEITQEHYLPVLIGLAIIGIGFAQSMKSSAALRDKVDAMLLKLPIFGEIISKAATARFARVLSTTFAAGVPLVDALESVSGAVGNAVYRDAVYRIRDDVASGQQMHQSMRASGVFSNIIVQMTSIGEESGALDTMLSKAAGYFEEEVNNTVDGMTELIEPAIMVFLGVVIGGMIIAMYLPIFEIGNAI